MTIELPDDVVAFMRELANEIKTQDNRVTASPFFYVVRSMSELVAPEGFGNGEEYYKANDEWDGKAHTKAEWREILKERDEENLTSTDLDSFLKDECECFGMHDVPVDDNVFLTEKGFNQHMQANGHNYRHYRKTFSYVKHCFRNPEMEKLHRAIMCFSEMQNENHEEKTK